MLALRRGSSATHKEAVMKKQDWPLTLKDATGRVLANLSKTGKQRIARMKKEDLIRLHRSLGICIRNELGLWQGNKALLKSCGGRPDYASGVIIEAAWKALSKKSLDRTHVEASEPPIAEIHVTDKGELALSVLQSDSVQPVSALKSALNEIRSQKNLKLFTEESLVVNGQNVVALKKEVVSPNDSRYIWAVAYALNEYGFEYHILGDTLPD